MSDSAEVLAYYENRQVKPTAFKYKDMKYLVTDILQTIDVDNPCLMVPGIKDRLYWVVTQDGTRITLRWHRNTGEWTVVK